MDETLWDDVVSLLGAGHRCVVPILPLGAHRLAMGPGADLSLRGQARLVRELFEDLDLRDVTIVGNDTGGAIVQLLMASGEERIGQAVLVSCDAFDNVPPGLTGKTIVALGKLAPSLFGAFVQQLRARPLRRLPFSFGWLTKRGDRTVRGWLRPLLGDRAIRRDAVGVLRGIGNERDVLVGAEPGLRRWDRPALVVWAAQDRVMPPEHGRRLAELLGAALVEIDDSHTLVPLDQPQALAAALREFITAKRAAEPEPARHRAPAEVRWEPA